MATDLFSTHSRGVSSPASHAAVVTPSDTSDLAFVTRALLIGTAGAVRVTMRGGETLVLPLQAGFNPIEVSRVWATSTTATGIVALW